MGRASQILANLTESPIYAEDSPVGVGPAKLWAKFHTNEHEMQAVASFTVGKSPLDYAFRSRVAFAIPPDPKLTWTDWIFQIGGMYSLDITDPAAVARGAKRDAVIRLLERVPELKREAASWRKIMAAKADPECFKEKCTALDPMMTNLSLVKVIALADDLGLTVVGEARQNYRNWVGFALPIKFAEFSADKIHVLADSKSVMDKFIRQLTRAGTTPTTESQLCESPIYTDIKFTSKPLRLWATLVHRDEKPAILFRVGVSPSDHAFSSMVSFDPPALEPARTDWEHSTNSSRYVDVTVDAGLVQLQDPFLQFFELVPAVKQAANRWRKIIAGAADRDTLKERYQVLDPVQTNLDALGVIELADQFGLIVVDKPYSYRNWAGYVLPVECADTLRPDISVLFSEKATLAKFTRALVRGDRA